MTSLSNPQKSAVFNVTEVQKGRFGRHMGPLVFMLALSACATDQQGVQVRTVSVPTPVACVDPEQVPKEPPQIGDQLNGDAVHDLGIVAPSALELRKWGRSLYALIVPGCETVTSPPPTH